jgi:hypothetical protein
MNEPFVGSDGGIGDATTGKVVGRDPEGGVISGRARTGSLGS